jgi:hypothetical protein
MTAPSETAVTFSLPACLAWFVSQSFPPNCVSTSNLNNDYRPKFGLETSDPLVPGPRGEPKGSILVMHAKFDNDYWIVQGAQREYDI